MAFLRDNPRLNLSTTVTPLPHEHPKKQRPSDRWNSYDDWKDNPPMLNRLRHFMSLINKDALISHVERLLHSPSPVTLSDRFSAGQYWCCFEFSTPDDRHLVIARVRLPRHPEHEGKYGDHAEEAETYLVQCEVATMAFLRDNVKTFAFPKCYAVEKPGSEQARRVGASYMLIKGFFGVTVEHAGGEVWDLPIKTQEHIMSQWTMAQAELASFTFPTIGSISEYSKEKSPIIGPIATASMNGFANCGPLSSTWEYFRNIADARFKAALARDTNVDSDPESPSELNKLGHFIFRDLVHNSSLFRSPPSASAPAVNDPSPGFPFNHMDLGIQNILVSTPPSSSSSSLESSSSSGSSSYYFLAIIDWEMAQSAPWEVFYYPVPFPLLSSQQESAILRDEKHPEYDRTVKKQRARELYCRKFREAEQKMEAEGRPLPVSIADVLEGSKASRCFGVVEKLGVFEGMEGELVRELVRLGYAEEGREMGKGEEEGWLKVKRREMEAFLEKGRMGED